MKTEQSRLEEECEFRVAYPSRPKPLIIDRSYRCGVVVFACKNNNFSLLSCEPAFRRIGRIDMMPAVELFVAVALIAATLWGTQLILIGCRPKLTPIAAVMGWIPLITIVFLVIFAYSYEASLVKSTATGLYLIACSLFITVGSGLFLIKAMVDEDEWAAFWDMLWR